MNPFHPAPQTLALPARHGRPALRLLQTAALGVAVACAAGLIAPARAADPLAAPGGAAGAASAATYTTVPGDTLERVLHKTLGHSPLKAELLREALVAANRGQLPPGRNPRLQPGTVLQLPDHAALLRRAVQPFLVQAELAEAGSPATAADPRRRWVRFP